MIKGILFDWHGVLVESNGKNDERIKEIYSKLLQNTATEDEVIEIVTAYEKYEPLWEILPLLKKHFKLCVVNNGPRATYNYWDEYFGYSKFMDFINSEVEGVEKPQPEIYKIACERLGVNADEVIYMDDNFGFPEETEKLNMKFIHWDSTESGFNKFKDYLNNNTEIKIS
ncbi:HAD-superfamily hydrolase, subfamily IA, variant 3 [Clostridium cellulovorans 743B]|uniref:HAD-superfamily hydrolase, subfamily IA, variant 3 n=1 Tax=Clostridium cellulovorans (strain ATCC 35296 / DSM 3052 / OCM 3 / 743B) TaxID=573061 RepID=D9ST33_CLOC7|nr:HAD-superfamily hydrolase, subfamily IA, variant 3 [Clostridium cellulovorans 743B]